MVLNGVPVQLKNSTIEIDNSNRPGIKIVGSSAALIYRTNIIGYKKGIKIDNSSLDANCSPMIRQSDIIFSNNNNGNSKGIICQGPVNIDLNDCDIENYQKGIILNNFDNEDRAKASTPTMTNSRFRNNPESSRGNSIGIKSNGNNDIVIDNCDFENYEKGFVYVDKEDRRSKDNVTPTLTNSRFRSNPESSRGNSIGIKFNANCNLIIDNCDIENFNKGFLYLSEQNRLRENSTPTLTNSRFRNNPESSRGNTIGIKIKGTCDFIVDNCDIDYFDKGLIYINGDENDRNRELSTPTLTNSRFRNNPESSRGNDIAIKTVGAVNIDINDCEIEDYSKGALIKNETEINSTPTMTNSRFRNNPESTRENEIGLKIIGNISCLIDSSNFENYEKAVIIKNDCGFTTTPMITHNNIILDSTTDRGDSEGLRIQGNISSCIVYNEIRNYTNGLFIKGEDSRADIYYNAIYLDNEYEDSKAVDVKYSYEMIVYNNTIFNYDFGFVSDLANSELYNNLIWKYNSEEEPVSFSPNIVVTYSNISRPDGLVYPGEGNVNLDPIFNTSKFTNLQLNGDSPCIDAGDPQSPPDQDGTIADLGCYPYFQGNKYSHQLNSNKSLDNLFNYPNPFNAKTTIKFELKEDSYIELEIYNMKGQKVQSLFTGRKDKGFHHILWNGLDVNDKNVSSGIYFVQLKTENSSALNKLILLK